MKRRLVLLPFEISRWAPEVAELEQAEGEEQEEQGDHPWLPRADRMALADFLRAEMARILAVSLSCSLLELEGDAAAESEELDDLELPLSSETASAAARETGLELGLACRLRADGDGAELSGVLADAAGEERVRFTLGSRLGEAHLLPLRAAREVLVALGEDAAAAELPDDPVSQEALVPVEAVLELARGVRALEEARRALAASHFADAPAQLARQLDPSPPLAEHSPPLAEHSPALAEHSPALADPSLGLEQLLEAVALAPSLLLARDAILREAAASLGQQWMPDCLIALERLVELLPGDAPALAALASYRRLHHDLEGAKELLLRARDLAGDEEEEAAVLSELASLAEEEGRTDEAVQHLRAATHLIDDPAIYLRLGRVLGVREPQESARSFQRAVVLAPEDPQARLALARQLSILGETGRAATEAARAAQLSRDEPELAQAASDFLRELINSARAGV